MPDPVKRERRGKRGDFCKSLPSSPVPPSPHQNLYRCHRRSAWPQERTPGRTPARLAGKTSVDQGNSRINPRCPHPWSIFRLKRLAFQTIRSGVSRKKRGFSAWFGPGGAMTPPRVSPFSQAKCSSLSDARQPVCFLLPHAAGGRSRRGTPHRVTTLDEGAGKRFWRDEGVREGEKGTFFRKKVPFSPSQKTLPCPIALPARAGRSGRQRL